MKKIRKMLKDTSHKKKCTHGHQARWRCSTARVLRETQIRATARYTPTRVAKLKSLSIPTVGKEQSNGNFCCWWERTMTQSLWVAVSEFLLEPNIRLPYESAIPSYSSLPEKGKRTCTHRFERECSQLLCNYNLKLEMTQMPIKGWADKHMVAHPHGGMLLSYIKGGKSPTTDT